MNEDIYLLLDGDLSDTDSALLFRQLSESSAERVAFRQQLRLQSALNKNEQFQGLTAQEDAALLTQLGSSVGLQPSATPVIAAQHADSVPASTAALTGATGWFSRRGVTMLFAGLVLGVGLGVTAERAFFADPQPQVITVATPGPQLLPPAASAINRDSLITALRDSLRTEVQAEMAKAESEKRQPRKKVVRRKSRPTHFPITGE
ncbi:MAG: hypothetical protein K1X90_10530 [Candidatus Kapabacteria bacterium]|nr:hypothetical protein [Candidatus Kapabacteria bacterium]